MATAPTAGYVYIIESETGVDDWITDHSGDPDNIDLDNYSVGNASEEGKGYCRLRYNQQWRITGMTGSKITTLGGSVQYSRRKNDRYYVVMANGVVISIGNANLINEYIMSDRHTSGSSAVFKPSYLILYHGLNSSSLVPKFTDHENNQRAYCLGEVIQFTRGWLDVRNSLMSINIKFASVWRTV